VKSGVYRIVNVATGKSYVGSSKNMEYRWRKHRTDLTCGSHVNPALQASWRKHGAAAFQFYVLEYVANVADLLPREQWWLDHLRTYDRKIGYNISVKAGAPMTGRKASPETLEKMRLVNTGRKHTQETKERIRAALTGIKRPYRPITDSQRKAIVKSNTGRRMSEEAKERIRTHNKGKKATDKARLKMSVANTGKKWSATKWRAYMAKHGYLMAMFPVEEGGA
jgi:group I intron endonuclease